MAVAVTGIKPTGTPHLGNYLGMIRPALDIASRTEAYYFIADAHALTTVRDGRRLRESTYGVAATWVALGLDPSRTALYRQSDIPEVFELAWILSCATPKGLLNRAHAYKAAVQANQAAGRDPDSGVNAGLYGYPVLMAADILLPGADLVPVGLDQRQHVEIARDVAVAFNAVYGDVVTLPEAVIDERVMTIPGTDGRKMSKSYDNVIPVLGSPEEIRASVMRIVTDSRRPEEPKDPEQDSIFRIYRLVAPPDAAASMANDYDRGGLSYAEAKRRLIDCVVETFREARNRYLTLLSHHEKLEDVLRAGANRVRSRATEVLDRVRAAVYGRNEPRVETPRVNNGP